MDSLLWIFTVILFLIGFGFAIWSIIDTRKKYYEEYLRRKRSEH